MLMLGFFLQPLFVFTILCTAALISITEQSTCRDLTCPCGKTGRYFTLYRVCLDSKNTESICRRWDKCKSCQDDLSHCLECPEGSEGLFCDITNGNGYSRQKKDSSSVLEGKPKRRAPYSYSKKPPFKLNSGAVSAYSNDTGSSGYERNSNSTAGVYRSRRRRRPQAENGEGEQYCLIPGSVDNSKTVYYPPGAETPTEELEWEYPQGARLQYTCLRGYKLEGLTSLTCELTGLWSGNPPVCALVKQAPQYCMVPGKLENGIIEYFAEDANSPSPLPEWEYPQRSRLRYSCLNGYKMDGADTLSCQDTGLWSGNPPTCTLVASGNRATSCEDPGFIENGNRRDRESESSTPRKFEENEFVIFDCNSDKFALRGSAYLSCRDGKWSRPLPRCIPAVATTCPDPGQVPNADRLNPDGTLSVGITVFRQGQSVVFACKPNFFMQRRSLLTCLASGQWSHSLPECVEVNAPFSGGLPEQTDCGVSSVKPTSRISHGSKTAPGEWPWVVAIAVRGRFRSEIICGGAVLDTRTVLTAAHCLENANSYVLYFGKQYRNDDLDDEEVVVRTTTQIVRHPDYNRTNFDSDIALLWFSPPLENYTHTVQPICLPTPETTTKNLMTGRIGYISGWGELETGLQADKLLLAELPVLPSSICIETYKRQNYSLFFTQNMFCAGYAVKHKREKHNACKGDSGSPLSFYDEKKERNVVEGLVSFRAESQCGTPGRYTVFTKVSRFIRWIHRNKS